MYVCMYVCMCTVAMHTVMYVCHVCICIYVMCTVHVHVHVHVHEVHVCNTQRLANIIYYLYKVIIIIYLCMNMNV